MAAPQPRLTLGTASSAPSSASAAAQAPALALKASSSASASAQAPHNAAPAAARTSSFPRAAVLPKLTTSSCTTEVEEGRHHFDLHRYGLLKELGVGNFVKSGTFDVGGYSWALLLYPSGSEAASAGQNHVSVYLQLMTPKVEVRTLFDLRLIDQSAGRWHSVFGDEGDRPRRYAVFSTFPTKLPLPPHHPPRCWGVPSWNASNLETKHIKNGTLTIRCDLTVIMPPRVSETKTLTQIQAPSPGLSKDLGRILKEKDGVDVTVRVGEEAFLAHRTVLAARSPVLRQKLLDAATDETKLSSIEITMDDGMEPAVFKAMLHFIYTDELPPDAQGRDDGDGETMEFVRRLFVAAEGCGIERLKQLCESLLYRNLSKRTLKGTMEFAGRHRCDKLMEACDQFCAAAGCHPPPGRVVCNLFDGLKRSPVDTSAACKRLKKN